MRVPFTGIFGTPDAAGEYHGTATLGVLIGDHNGFGIAGISHLSPFALAVGTNGNTTGVIAADAISYGTGLLSAGDVMLIELQTFGALPAVIDGDLQLCGHSGAQGLAAVPLEYESVVFDAIAVATANRIVVVEPAGNGAVSLDHPAFLGIFDMSSPNYRDSGAIMVASSMVNRAPHCSSNYGSRVDVSAQGEHFPSAWGSPSNNGWFFNPAGDDNQKYGQFGGTSSASAIVAGAAAVAQSLQKARGGPVLSSERMRILLRTDGTPQATDTRRIGPMPNLAAIHLWMLGDLDGDGISNVTELALGRRPDLSEAALVSALTSLFWE